MNMVRRTKNDGGTAVADPHDIAARIAAADADARRAQVVADIEEFRTVCASIADGHEPDGKALASIGDLARRLRLPPEAVSKAVAAIQTDRKHAADAARAKEVMVSVKEREPELKAAIKAAETRLRDLREELVECAGAHAAYPFQVQAMNALRGENPLLFAPVDHVADRLTAADTGMSLAALKALEPQPMVAEGHGTRASWGG